jgi:tripartite-type tricarboxylate transporter receptor subunit TctC
VARLIHAAAIVLCATVFGAAGTYGQDYPSRPVKVEVPFPPGPADTLARLYAQKLSEKLGQPFIVENRTGATGTVGAAVVAHAAPDGYTLLSSPDLPLVKAPNLVKVTYDPVADFEPIAIVGQDSNILAAYPGSGLTSLADVVAAAKARPGAINFASAGNGSPGHLCGEMINLAAGIKLSHIPYRGAGPAMTAVVSGEVQLFCGPIEALLPNIRDGRLLALAVTGARPIAQLPDVKPLSATWPGIQITTWYAFLAPPATPQPVIDALRQALRSAYDDAALQDRQREVGVDPRWVEGGEVTQLIKADLAKWRNVIDAAHIKIE